MQMSEDMTDLYAYMDFTKKKISVYYNDEKPLKLNIEKIAKKRLNVKDFWKDISDVRLLIDKETLNIEYHF